MNKYKGTVLKVKDADTLDAIVDIGFGVTQKFTIRIFGVDAPEKSTQEGKDATALVKNLLEGKEVYFIETKKKDKYGRTLAKIEFGKKDFSDFLIENGMGKEYYGGKKTLFSLAIDA